MQTLGLSDSTPRTESRLKSRDTFFDKFADQWPTFILPEIKILYYIFSFEFVVLVVAGLIIMILHGGHAL